MKDKIDVIFHVNNKKINIDDKLLKIHETYMYEKLNENDILYYLKGEARILNKNIKNCNEIEIKSMIESALRKELRLRGVLYIEKEM